jgi:hypothetical protein
MIENVSKNCLRRSRSSFGVEPWPAYVAVALVRLLDEAVPRGGGLHLVRRMRVHELHPAAGEELEGLGDALLAAGERHLGLEAGDARTIGSKRSRLNSFAFFSFGKRTMIGAGIWSMMKPRSVAIISDQPACELFMQRMPRTFGSKKASMTARMCGKSAQLHCPTSRPSSPTGGGASPPTPTERSAPAAPT